MDNPDLLFFCTMCKKKPLDEIKKIKCTIPHSIKNFKKGDYVICQGEDISSLYLLSKGKLRLEMITESGVRLPIEEVSAPYPLASSVIFAENNKFIADVIALENVEIILIKKQAIENQMTKCTHFLRGYLAFAANNEQRLSERLKIYSFKSIKSKFAFYILQRSSQKGDFELEQSIASLADYFGVERPSLSRAISEMVKENLIEFEGGKGKIIHFNKIKEYL